MTDKQTADGEAGQAFLGRMDGVNQVKVQFTYIRDEYRKDLADTARTWPTRTTSTTRT